MSLVDKLTNFFRLKVKQLGNSIFISQSKYAKHLVKNLGLESASHMRTPLMSTKDDRGWCSKSL